MEFRKITSVDFNAFKSLDLLFYQPAYLEAQNYENPIAFAVYNQTKLQAVIVFNGYNGMATSLNRSPFGSLHMIDKVPHPVLQQFLSYIKRALEQEGCRNMEITLPPDAYENFIPFEFWKSEGFKALSEEINQHLVVTEAFEPRLHQMERRKLKRLNNGKVHFQLEPSSTNVLTECHKFIAECRKDQGLEINISLEKLLTLSFQLKDRYEVFTARIDGSIVAAVITCLIDKDHLYYYLPATDYRFKKESPMVGLVHLIYKECNRRGIKYLDFGVSSVNGELQEGLYDFKKRLGADSSRKMIVYLSW